LNRLKVEVSNIKQDDSGSKKILIFYRTDKVLVRTERIGYFTKSVRHPRDEKGRAFQREIKYKLEKEQSRSRNEG